MTALFADTFYWIALADFTDSAHQRALALTTEHAASQIITTDEVLTEYLTFFSTAPEPLCVLPLPRSRFSRILEGMEVHFTPETEEKLKALAAQSGRGNADELVQDVVEGYFDELAQTRDMLNRRYDDLKSGRVKPIDGEEFFENLRRREDELLKKHSPQ